ncbi:uncharacterized protein K452DRAFT_294295 [Aplosporella prunicola CBS 121167]|uniref:BAH domain-containing protein n=1 Tax=Aplosporella prunicola CBS 121167 TaxID=1176127 RepID=A0A6A6BRN2_9PEZI|nr:uncharacterized protein K452DRAFT_294295 [Aplosporella prunicola CBS 121167]KAF2146752.1 hypothetical protein K452DRAFT_294295 [Aplosporella prunicola CBS 121167]
MVSSSASKQRRTPRHSSVTDARRDGSLSKEPTPAASSKSPAAGNSEDKNGDQPSAGQLDWTKFKRGFTVKNWSARDEAAAAPKNSKKRRRSSLSTGREPLLEENPFDRNLDTYYKVEPVKWWNDTKRYRKFTIANETFRLGETVFVQGHDPGVEPANWVAKVLEVRAANELNVFLRVYWFNRPEDLPMGRQPHHGHNEVIATNTMQIIDALTVNGKATVKHWKETDGEEILDEDTLFWRQTFDCPAGGPVGTLSEIRTHCIDNKPYNPDSTLVYCVNCEKWLHAECVANDVLVKTYEEHNMVVPSSLKRNDVGNDALPVAAKGTATPKSKTPKKTKGKNSTPKVTDNDAAEEEEPEQAFSAEIRIDKGETPKVLVTDARNGKKEVTEKPVHCLFCKNVVA